MCSDSPSHYLVSDLYSIQFFVAHPELVGGSIILWSLEVLPLEPQVWPGNLALELCLCVARG